MMGKDCERIVLGIDTVIKELQSTMRKLSASLVWPIEMVQYASNSSDDITIKEKELDYPLSLSSLSSILDGLNQDFTNMSKLKGDLYTDSSTFNNSCGSPWNELDNMKSAVETVIDATDGDITYPSQLLALMPMINVAISSAIDAKSSLLMYHDYIQRGYDAVYNGKRASIEFAKTYTRKTVGNIRQDFSENVNIEPVSFDPF